MHRILAPVVLLAVLLIPAAASADEMAPCTPGAKGAPRCHWWDARVTSLDDGDTIKVDTDGEGRQQVRFVGINAMELHRYARKASDRRGDCMGVPAANNLERAIKAAGGRVRLAAQRPASHSGHGRVYRSVWARVKGKLVDLSAMQLQDGYVLFLPNQSEWWHNREYQRYAAEARARGKRLWDPRACPGVAPGARLSLAVKWDADGTDKSNLNDEWIEIRNAGSAPVDIGGWWARDSWLNWFRNKPHGIPGYQFGRGTEVPAQGFLRLHIGCGGQQPPDLHWCQRSDAFENVTYDRTHLGDGAYLFDRRGSLRASFLYPCVEGCADPLAGRVALDPRPRRPESIRIENRSGQPVDLGDHVLKYRNDGRVGNYVFGRVFPRGTTIPANGTFVYRHPTDDRFKDAGGVVELRTLDDQLTDCADWGNRHC